MREVTRAYEHALKKTDGSHTFTTDPVATGSSSQQEPNVNFLLSITRKMSAASGAAAIFSKNGRSTRARSSRRLHGSGPGRLVRRRAQAGGIASSSAVEDSLRVMTPKQLKWGIMAGLFSAEQEEIALGYVNDQHWAAATASKRRDKHREMLQRLQLLLRCPSSVGGGGGGGEGDSSIETQKGLYNNASQQQNMLVAIEARCAPACVAMAKANAMYAASVAASAEETTFWP